MGNRPVLHLVAELQWGECRNLFGGFALAMHGKTLQPYQARRVTEVGRAWGDVLAEQPTDSGKTMQIVTLMAMHLGRRFNQAVIAAPLPRRGAPCLGGRLVAGRLGLARTRGQLFIFTATPYRSDGRPVQLEGMRVLRRSLPEHIAEGFAPR